MEPTARAPGDVPQRVRARETRRPPIGFALSTLAIWRLTHLLTEEDGPFDFVAELRTRAGASQLGKLMDCFYCLSIWVAAPFAFATARRARDTPTLSLALSGAACLLEQATRRSEPSAGETVRAGSPDDPG